MVHHQKFIIVQEWLVLLKIQEGEIIIKVGITKVMEIGMTIIQNTIIIIMLILMEVEYVNILRIKKVKIKLKKELGLLILGMYKIMDNI